MPAPTSGECAAFVERERARKQLVRIARISFVLIGGFPWFLPVARHLLPLGQLGAFLDGLFILVCHRLPERTLTLVGVEMPLCSRCAGIFAGLALGALIAQPRMSLRQARYAVLISGTLLLLDVLAQDFGLHPLWHSSRLISGGLLGYVLSAALIAAILREGRTNAAGRR